MRVRAWVLRFVAYFGRAGPGTRGPRKPNGNPPLGPKGRSPHPDPGPRGRPARRLLRATAFYLVGAQQILVGALPKPYKFIGFGAINVTKPYEFIRFGDIHGPTPYKLIGFGDIYGGLSGRPPWVTPRGRGRWERPSLRVGGSTGTSGQAKGTVFLLFGWTRRTHGTQEKPLPGCPGPGCGDLPAFRAQRWISVRLCLGAMSKATVAGRVRTGDGHPFQDTRAF